MSDPDFARVAQLYRLCAHHQISFEMIYNEGSQSWCFNLNSAAPSERYIGKDYSFDGALDCVIEFIENGFKRPRD